jgi:hypothetical protein
MSDPVVSFVFFVWSDFSIDEVHGYAKRIRKLTELNLLVQPVNQKNVLQKMAELVLNRRQIVGKGSGTPSSDEAGAKSEAAATAVFSGYFTGVIFR